MLKAMFYQGLLLYNFSDRHNEAIAASFNGRQKLCFTLVKSRRYLRTNIAKLHVAVYKRDHYPSSLTKGTKSNQLGRNTRKFVVGGFTISSLLYVV